MEQRRLRSGAAAEAPRARLLSGWALTGIALTMATALVLVFPRQTLIEQVRLARGNDPLSLAYLANLVKAEPDNAELRLLLAERKLAVGDLDQARKLLGTLTASRDPALRHRALRLEYRLRELETMREPRDSAQWRAALARQAAALRALAKEPLAADELVYFARDARALGETGLARKLYARLVASDAQLDAPVLEEASAAALAVGDYESAAQLLFALQARASGLEQKRKYFLRAVATLQAGDLLGAALDAADAHIGALADDEQTLQFLARLALAADQPARAARYMRRLLHISRFDALAAKLAALGQSWIASALAADDDAPQPPPAGMRPYDPRLYRLAYDIFLANHSLDDAYKVADAAVRQVPRDSAWRQRLAQVAEWSGKPAAALQQWLYLARHGGGDQAVQAILRLAPGLHDDAALLYAWQQWAGTHRPDAKQWRLISDLYERLDRPLEAVQYFETAYAAHAEPVLLELMARLDERAGRIDAAIRQYRRLIATDGDTPGRATKLATLYLLKPDFKQAYAALAPLRASAPASDSAYWNLLADLAWQLQHDDAALQAYTIKTQRAQVESIDAERLVQLMRVRAPEEAARLAASLYRRLDTPALFLTAAEIHWQRRDLVALKRLYAGLTPAEEARLAAIPYFLTLRADYYQARGNGRAALADFERALALEPRDTGLRTGLLWLLIDMHRPDELRRRLRAWQGPAASEPAYWGAYAAAWMSLDEPRLALPWYARELEAKRDDYLWLLSYADALEQAGKASMAWRVRRHAWGEARKARTARGAQSHEAMLAYARLATQFAPGDASLALLRNLLRQDRESAQPLDAASKELVLSWLLSREQNDAARAWLWRQYGRDLAQPAWAELALALAQNDRATLERLLASAADALPAAGRVDAARALRDLRLAQSYAFSGLEARPHDDELHQRLAEDALASAASASLRDTRFRRGALDGRERALAVELWATPRLRLGADLDLIDQSSRNAQALPGVPATERQAGLSALWRHERGDTELGLAQRSALTEFNTLRLAHTERWAEGLNSSFSLTRHERADETVALGLAGHRDRAYANLGYDFSKRDYLVAAAWWADYHTQAGHDLGRGRGVDYELGHRLRTEYPDLVLRYSGTLQRYRPGGMADALSARFTADGSIPAASFFLPQSFNLQGINVGIGDSARGAYTRALRAYADFGRSYNTLTGNGYNWLIGAAGSVLGPDSLSFYLMRARGGGGTDIEVREFGLRYRYYFDGY